MKRVIEVIDHYHHLIDTGVAFASKFMPPWREVEAGDLGLAHFLVSG